MNKKIEYIWLSKLAISNRLKMLCINKLGGIHEFYNSSLDDLVYLNLNDNIIIKILNSSFKVDAQKDFEYMEKNNINIISFEDNNYPAKLKFINDFPICFYYIGNISTLNKNSIAIVGSRIATKESLEVSRKVASLLSKKSINIVSGLARGIDKFAHLGCLDVNDGKPIAVLGAGIDKESIYPFENIRVFERIIEKDGIVISEYPLKTKPYSYNFPYRNRIISGLSDSVIVIQASLKSGSLITVDYALDQGKDVYVYKTLNLDDEKFGGNKLLIEQGAKYFQVFEN